MQKGWDGKERREYSVEEVVEMTIPKVLLSIGFDMSDPTSIQKDIQHLRRSREICEMIKNKAILCLASIFVVAVLGAAFIGMSVNVAERQQQVKRLTRE